MMRARSPDDPDVEDGVYYPCSDGKPMGETDVHIITLRLLLDALDDVFVDRADAYVSGHVNWYWEKGNPARRQAPRAMVVFGVEKEPRRSFRSWNEGGAVPAVCFEIASARTWRKYLGPVRDDYEAAGVREYFVFDPTREYLEAPIVGFQLRGRHYHPVRTDEAGAMLSREQRLVLVPEGLMLRLVRLDTAELVLTREERIAVSRAKAAAYRARAKESAREVARQRSRLTTLQRSNGEAMHTDS
jgi:Uma2 family endonuclease